MVRRLIPLSGLGLLFLIWQATYTFADPLILPSPAEVGAGIVELARRGLLHRYVIASLFRVTWGFVLAALTAIPLGMILGLSRRGTMACNPLVQILRPISPLAWIPLAILWFGVGDVSAIFLIFIASFFPLVVASMNAVHSLDRVYLDAAQNFGLSGLRLIFSIILPAVLPQLLVALRITLGIAWLVVVAAEMIAVNSGLGFLIIDARNAGNRYDLVVAGMVLIGVVGLLLDLALRRIERLRAVQWGYSLP